MKLLYSLLFIPVVTFAGNCEQFFPFGTPKTNGIELCRIAYVTHYSKTEKLPIFSAELLVPENLNGKHQRSNNFQEDPSLPSYLQVIEQDLISSGFDRGHLAPAEDMRQNSAALKQSFYMSNIVPQNPYMNRGAWKSLETYARKIAMTYNHAYVITGTIKDESSFVLNNGPIVPTYLYKIIVTTQPFQMVAFMMPNNDVRGTKYTNFAVPVSVIESKTKINFFPKMPAKYNQAKTFINSDLVNFK